MQFLGNFDKPLRVKSPQRSNQKSQERLLGESISNNYDRLVNEIDRASQSPLRRKGGSREGSQSSLTRLQASGLTHSVTLQSPLRRMKTNNRPLLDQVRERYTYNLGNGNYLVLEEVDAKRIEPKHSNSLYVKGSGAPDDCSTLVIDDLRH